MRDRNTKAKDSEKRSANTGSLTQEKEVKDEE